MGAARETSLDYFNHYFFGLLRLKESRGYRLTNKIGESYGVAYMGISAILVRDVKKFKKRDDLINSIYFASLNEIKLKQLPKDSKQVQQLISQLIQKNILKRFTQLSAEKQLDIRAFFDDVEIFRRGFDRDQVVSKKMENKKLNR